MKTIRAFVAVPLPDQVVGELRTVQHELKRRVPNRSVRWVHPESIHLTLKFLGDTPEEKLIGVKKGLTAIAHNAPPFDLSIGGLGCFPNPDNARVLWVGVEEPTGCLEIMHRAIEEVMETLGYERERRDFHPHLTIGRVRRRTRRGERRRIGDIVSSRPESKLADITADHFELIQSVLKPTGAEYTTLHRFELQG